MNKHIDFYGFLYENYISSKLLHDVRLNLLSLVMVSYCGIFCLKFNTSAIKLCLHRAESRR